MMFAILFVISVSWGQLARETSPHNSVKDLCKIFTIPLHVLLSILFGTHSDIEPGPDRVTGHNSGRNRLRMLQQKDRKQQKT